MAKVWFVRRRGGQWVAPGGTPVHEAPLDALLFPLDLGVHRRLWDERPQPEPALPAEPPDALERVIVETEPSDVAARTFSGFVVGFYDSPYPPPAAAARLGLTT